MESKERLNKMEEKKKEKRKLAHKLDHVYKELSS